MPRFKPGYLVTSTANTRETYIITKIRGGGWLDVKVLDGGYEHKKVRAGIFSLSPHTLQNKEPQP